jgi:hypothetical protein
VYGGVEGSSLTYDEKCFDTSLEYEDESDENENENDEGHAADNQAHERKDHEEGSEVILIKHERENTKRPTVSLINSISSSNTGTNAFYSSQAPSLYGNMQPAITNRCAQDHLASSSTSSLTVSNNHRNECRQHPTQVDSANYYNYVPANGYLASVNNSSLLSSSSSSSDLHNEIYSNQPSIPQKALTSSHFGFYVPNGLPEYDALNSNQLHSYSSSSNQFGCKMAHQQAHLERSSYDSSATTPIATFNYVQSYENYQPTETSQAQWSNHAKPMGTVCHAAQSRNLANSFNRTSTSSSNSSPGSSFSDSIALNASIQPCDHLLPNKYLTNSSTSSSVSFVLS